MENQYPQELLAQLAAMQNNQTNKQQSLNDKDLSFDWLNNQKKKITPICGNFADGKYWFAGIVKINPALMLQALNAAKAKYGINAFRELKIDTQTYPNSFLVFCSYAFDEKLTPNENQKKLEKFTEALKNKEFTFKFCKANKEGSEYKLCICSQGIEIEC